MRGIWDRIATHCVRVSFRALVHRLERIDFPHLTNLDGLSALTSVNLGLTIRGNDNLRDCEVCDLLDQFTSAPDVVVVSDNLDDTCTPVPANCP